MSDLFSVSFSIGSLKYDVTFFRSGKTWLCIADHETGIRTEYRTAEKLSSVGEAASQLSALCFTVESECFQLHFAKTIDQQGRHIPKDKAKIILDALADAFEKEPEHVQKKTESLRPAVSVPFLQNDSGLPARGMLTPDMMIRKSAPEDFSADRPWKCEHCGSAENGSALTCENCGSPSPFAWICPTCRQSETLDHCRTCMTSRPATAPRQADAPWNCACGASGITAKFCLRCGKPRAEMEKALRDPKITEILADDRAKYVLRINGDSAVLTITRTETVFENRECVYRFAASHPALAAALDDITPDLLTEQSDSGRHHEIVYNTGKTLFADPAELSKILDALEETLALDKENVNTETSKKLDPSLVQMSGLVAYQPNPRNSSPALGSLDPVKTAAMPAQPFPGEKTESGAWDCACGMTALTSKFCPECGSARPKFWKCGACGTENSGRFCTECGNMRSD